jgi:hypothetical protein
MIFNAYFSKTRTHIKDIKTLEEMFVVENLISDCNLLAKKKQSTCYKNNLSFFNNIDYKAYKISSVYVDNLEIYKSTKKAIRCYQRGVIFNGFNILEVCFYD